MSRTFVNGIFHFGRFSWAQAAGFLFVLGLRTYPTSTDNTNHWRFKLLSQSLFQVVTVIICSRVQVQLSVPARRPKSCPSRWTQVESDVKRRLRSRLKPSQLPRLATGRAAVTNGHSLLTWSSIMPSQIAPAASEPEHLGSNGPMGSIGDRQQCQWLCIVVVEISIGCSGSILVHHGWPLLLCVHWQDLQSIFNLPLLPTIWFC